MHVLSHPVVLGNEIGNLRYDLIAKYPKACDSIKSPSILKSSILIKGQSIFFSK